MLEDLVMYLRTSCSLKDLVTYLRTSCSLKPSRLVVTAKTCSLVRLFSERPSLRPRGSQRPSTPG